MTIHMKMNWTGCGSAIRNVPAVEIRQTEKIYLSQTARVGMIPSFFFPIPAETGVKYSGDSSRAGQKRRGRQASPSPAEQRHRQTSSHRPGSHTRKKRRKTGFLKIFCLAAAVIAGVWAFHWFRDDGYWTIAVFGVDSRDGNTGKSALSDVEMLCSIHRKTGEILDAAAAVLKILTDV